MTDLSPAAQAVLDAADNQPFKKPDGDLNLEGAIAAALRAVAMEVVFNKYRYTDWQMADMIMKEIQAIADELDPPNS